MVWPFLFFPLQLFGAIGQPGYRRIVNAGRTYEHAEIARIMLVVGKRLAESV